MSFDVKNQINIKMEPGAKPEDVANAINKQQNKWWNMQVRQAAQSVDPGGQ